ncbi:MAG: nucleotidyltransferase domain-containing protein [Methanophagales archaeon]|nr:nucleotidyltransferase domain-containing protein [Methanophagales archaeon]
MFKHYSLKPIKADNYIEDLLTILKSTFKQKLESIILFGSLAEGYFSEDVSDVDIIVVLSDDSSKEDIKKSREIIKNIEIKYNFSQKTDSFRGRLLKFFDEQTGMFVSYFVCKKSDLIQGNFNKIFLRSPIFFLIADIAVPKKIVLTNVFGRASIVYGNNVLQEIKIPIIGIIDIIKDFIMNFCLSLFAISIYPFSDKATKYSMEARKWSFINCHTFLHKQSTNLAETYEYYIQNKFTIDYIERMMQLRKKYEKNANFVLKTPLCILVVHFIAFLCRPHPHFKPCPKQEQCKYD